MSQLFSIRDWIGSQWRVLRRGETLFRLWALKTSLAAEFWTFCSFSIRYLGQPERSELQQSNLERTKADVSDNNMYDTSSVRCMNLWQYSLKIETGAESGVSLFAVYIYRIAAWSDRDDSESTQMKVCCSKMADRALSPVLSARKVDELREDKRVNCSERSARPAPCGVLLLRRKFCYDSDKCSCEGMKKYTFLFFIQPDTAVCSVLIRW